MNNDLKNDVYTLPSTLIKQLKSNLSSLAPSDKGYARCKNILSSGQLTHTQAKKLKHELENDMIESEYDVVGGERQIKQKDFDAKVDIIPVADPNIFSQTQRVTMAQTQLQMAMSNPRIHNLYNAYRDMYEALGVKNIDSLLPPPAPPKPMDPSVEHMMALSQKSFKAFPGQDHTAHMKAHLSFMGTQIARTNPNILVAVQKNILEHISLMAQEQVQLEFKEEIAQVQQMTMQMQQAGGQNPQMKQIQMQILKKLSNHCFLYINSVLKIILN